MALAHEQVEKPSCQLEPQDDTYKRRANTTLLVTRRYKAIDAHYGLLVCTVRGEVRIPPARTQKRPAKQQKLGVPASRWSPFDGNLIVTLIRMRF